MSNPSSLSPVGNRALVPLWVAGLYRDAPAGLRVQLLERLLRPMGVLGLVAVADGVFAALRHLGWEENLAASLGILIVLGMRLAAIRWKLSLPLFRKHDEPEH